MEVASNHDWTNAGRASLLEVTAAKLGIDELPHESNDAGLLLMLEEGTYYVTLENASETGSEAQFELYLLE